MASAGRGGNRLCLKKGAEERHLDRLSQYMCREAPKAVIELENYGLPFSRTGQPARRDCLGLQLRDDDSRERGLLGSLTAHADCCFRPCYLETQTKGRSTSGRSGARAWTSGGEVRPTAAARLLIGRAMPCSTRFTGPR